MAKSWSPEEDQQVIILRSEGFSLREIANRINRSYGAVRNRASYLGLTENRKWTREELERVIELRREGKTAVYIAKCVNRSVAAVNGCLAKLRSTEARGK